MLNAGKLAADVSSLMGLGFLSATSGSLVLLHSEDIPAPEGFSLKLELGWKSMSMELVMDNYSGKLLRAMSSVGHKNRELIAGVIKRCEDQGVKVRLDVNHSRINNIESLPLPPWTHLSLQGESFADFSSMDSAKKHTWVVEKACAFAGVVVGMLPLTEKKTTAAPNEEGLPEGASVKVLVNRYERNPMNRAKCLAIHGTVCAACGLEFEKKYGNRGRGFIEVHHNIMVSEMGAKYEVNPAKDLVPLCSNCHAMIHRTNPPITVDELKKMLK